ncbi:MAG: hypothetical protein PQ612_03420 [Rickettsiales bacterium]|nr:hypothetical protein [Pseudomonadota bacterium]MDA0965838.1 hypothetical protein [Pseudomonadota bacterium]MDG4542692.1 hypothetical protein [Rickettsiales bacterium]MDG4545196.1 hypothetical protein [Rickettsiales bacterium]MDG4547319.1 hypothetical protein [Rickettsiales bacterium]
MGEKNKTCNKELSKKIISALELDLTDMKITGKRILQTISELSENEKKELFSCNRFESDNQIYEGSFLDIVSHNINNNKVVNFILDEADKYGLADFQLTDTNNREQSTALHRLASHTCPEVLTHALEVLGDNANKALSIRDRNGNTPIH